MKHGGYNENSSTSHGELFDFIEGRRLRDEGIKLVSDHNETWMERCIKFATQRAAAAKRDFTGEDIRFACELSIGPPKHSNAWGALVNTLVRRKIIIPTGEHRPMKDKVSHARSTPVYQKAI